MKAFKFFSKMISNNHTSVDTTITDKAIIDKTIIDKTYNLCRKNALISEDLLSSLKRIESYFLSQSSSPSLNTSDTIEILDGLHKITELIELDSDFHKSPNRQTVNNILKEIVDLICNKSNLKITTTVGKIYNHNTDVVMASKHIDQDLPNGTIINIISQGYIKNGHELLKKANVVVSA
ncbi:MAG: nucleotide exchange factor GrpE [Oligoflexia bacterium]|nr:nucleotide exchange factor GrpE [Oligoflexia bacterium]